MMKISQPMCRIILGWFFTRSRLRCSLKRCILVLLNTFVLALFVCFCYFQQSISNVELSFNFSQQTSNSSHSLNLSASSFFSLFGAITEDGFNDDDDDDDEDLCIEFFLTHYQNFCEFRQSTTPRFAQKNRVSKLCPCVPKTLIGSLKIDRSPPSLKQLELAVSGSAEIGRWHPAWCVARQRIAIIVPYADRETHLRTFLNHMHSFLQRQLLDYNIFVIEQVYPELFNRAMLMNIGFMEANSTDEFDCYIFHDIDQLPIDDRNFYVCSDVPRHVVGYRKKFNYSYAYATSFGGGNSFTSQEFQLINGYSNSFYGWGGEDDDLFQRTQAKKVRRTRYPRCIAKYDEVEHVRDKRNPMGVNQPLGFIFRPEIYASEGLNSLNYTVVAVNRNKLFTKISVRLPAPPSSPSFTDKAAGWLVTISQHVIKMVRDGLGLYELESRLLLPKISAAVAAAKEERRGRGRGGDS